MSRLKPNRTAEPVSRDQILRRERGQINFHFPCSADHDQEWQLYPVDPYSAICDDHKYQSIAVLVLRKDHERAATNPWMLSRKKRCGSRPGKRGMID